MRFSTIKKSTLTVKVLYSYNPFTLCRIRNFDRKFIKPLLLRDDDVSLDQKLMFNFNVINENQMTKYAADPGFIMNNKESKSNEDLPNSKNDDKYLKTSPVQ